MTVRIYEYRAKTATDMADLVSDQMHLAHRYHNALVEIERARRQKVREVLEGHPDTEKLAGEVKTLADELHNVRAEINLLRRQTRSAAKLATQMLRDRACELKPRLKAARADLRVAKALIADDAVVQTALADVNKTAADQVKSARAASGLYWGTYLIVEQAVEQASKAIADPHFKRWTGNGHLAVQLQGGLDAALIHEPDTRCWIERPTAQSDSRKGRRRLQKTVMRFRVGSEGRDPIFAVIPIDYHQPLPAGRIKWVHLLRQKRATRYVWKVQFVVDAEPEKVACGHGTVAIDVGWRLLDDGSLRVAYWVDEFGREGELRLPAMMLRKDQHADSIRAVRDKIFDEVKPRIHAWLQTVDHEAMGADPAHVHLWRNPRRVLRLYDEHRDQMPADLVERLEAWRRNDLHLGQWEVEESRRVLRQRREVYRQFANTLSTAYSRVVLEKFDLRDATKRGDAEEGTRDQRKQNYGRFVACVSDLRQRIHNACGRRGADIAEVPAEWTTTDCHCCQHRNTWDQAAKLRYTCEQCGAEWDQDENAAHNLLARAPAVTPVEEGAREGQDSGKKVLSRRQQRFRGMLEEQQARRLQSADGGE